MPTFIGPQVQRVALATPVFPHRPSSRTMSTYNGALDAAFSKLVRSTEFANDTTNGLYFTGLLDPHNSIVLQVWGEGSSAAIGSAFVWGVRERAGWDSSNVYQNMGYTAVPLAGFTLALDSNTWTCPEFNASSTVRAATLALSSDYTLRGVDAVWNNLGQHFDGTGMLGYLIQVSRGSTGTPATSLIPTWVTL